MKEIAYFKKADWIWVSEKNEKDQFAEFVSHFYYDKGEIHINLSCDSDYTLYVNGVVASFGQYPDYPHYKSVDTINITNYCKKGFNRLAFEIWYYGEDFNTYNVKDAGLIFEVYSESGIILYSNESTQSRISLAYRSGSCKLITKQLGYTTHYNSSIQDCWKTSSADGFKNSVVKKVDYKYIRRPVQKLQISEDRIGNVYYCYENSIVVDLLREETGYIEIDFISPIEQEIVIAFGEHLDSGHVRRIIGDRDFSISYYAKRGRNRYTNYFRRVGCRYLEVFFKKKVTSFFAGLRPIKRFAEKNIFLSDNPLRIKIYNTALRTLLLCCNDHYEDCPWREQSMYILDARIQMLSGYYALKGFEFPRANIILIAKGVEGGRLFNASFPGGRVCYIPFFSLTYPLMVYEYILFSGDTGIISEVYQPVKNIINTFTGFISDDKNLIPHLPYPFWNFYEWSEGNDNFFEENVANVTDVQKRNERKGYDLALNAMYLIALDCAKYIEEKGNIKGVDYSRQDDVKKEIIKTFFDKTRKIFYSTTLDNKRNVSILANSIAVLCGIEEFVDPSEIMKSVLEDKSAVPVTLSMKIFLYEALLKADKKYSEYILQDIEKDYGYMLSMGATSFWETIKGADDFDGAGSLCHGWSTLPLIYYNKLV